MFALVLIYYVLISAFDLQRVQSIRTLYKRKGRFSIISFFLCKFKNVKLLISTSSLCYVVQTFVLQEYFSPFRLR